MANALDGLRQFRSDTVTITVIEAERTEEIAARNLASASLVGSAKNMTAGMRCACCNRRADDVAAFLHVGRAGEGQGFGFLCAKCGHADAVVQNVVDRLTRYPELPAGI